MYGLQEHEMRFYCLFKKVYFSLLATSDFFCRHAYAYAHMRIIRHESDMAAYAWPSLVYTLATYSAFSKTSIFNVNSNSCMQKRNGMCVTWALFKEGGIYVKTLI